MTRPVFEPTPTRKAASQQFGIDQLFRRPAAAGPHYPICFRAAVGPTADPENDRVHYPSGEDPDVVYWDHWDLEYDGTVYDTTLYEQDVLGIPCIGGVGLTANGIYSIHAQIDVQTYTNITYQIGTNFDEGQVEFGVTNNIAEVGEPFYGDNYLFQVNQWRQVVDYPPIPDQLWGGEATTVEITFSFSGETAMPGVTSGVWDGAAPDPAGELWIPGGYNGAWGYLPNMLVMYWGPVDGDPEWPASIFGS